MLRIVFLGLAATGFTPTTHDGAIAADRAVYEAARAKAAQQPAALVKLSLWCEAHGFDSERAKLLLEAINIEPGNVAARGLLGASPRLEARRRAAHARGHRANNICRAGLGRAALQPRHRRNPLLLRWNRQRAGVRQYAASRPAGSLRRTGEPLAVTCSRTTERRAVRLPFRPMNRSLAGIVEDPPIEEKTASLAASASLCCCAKVRLSGTAE
jgi:hypothetical protein